MARPLTIACLQTRPMPGFDSAIAEALPLARRAVDGGAQLLCLPEYCGGLMSRDGAIVPPAATEDAHPVLAALSEFAAEAGVWMQIGSIAVDGPPNATGDTIINRGFLVDADGFGPVLGEQDFAVDEEGHVPNDLSNRGVVVHHQDSPFDRPCLSLRAVARLDLGGHAGQVDA